MQNAPAVSWPLLLAAVVLPLFAGGKPMEEQPASDAMGKLTLGCRLASYGAFSETAWSHLQEIGVGHVFFDVPEPEDLPSIREKLTGSKLKPEVLRGRGDLGQSDFLAQIAGQLATCESLGAGYMFLSPRHTGIDKEAAYEILRAAGELARKRNVVIALETHPDLGTNAETHLETMRRVNHPNIRVNFDTGNITYYNKNASAAAELERVIDYVATIEIKDHDGLLESWHFPALGTGEVDFPAILRTLEQHNFQGPVTIEVEGIRGQVWNEDQTKRAIADSVAYIRAIAHFN